MEHRCGYRYAIEVAVLIATSHGLIGKGVLTQMSITGGVMRSSLPLRVESLVRVRFQSGGRRIRRLRTELAGQIVRREEGEFAVEWVEFAAEEIRELLASIQKQPVPQIAPIELAVSRSK